MKIAAYGIGKNEEKNIVGWYEGIKDADYVLYLDTGSTDKTVEIAKSLGIDVKFAYLSPWDETIAKNTALSLIPLDFDYCINLDIDQHMKTKNWKSIIENNAVDHELLGADLHFSEGLAANNVKKRIFRIHTRKGMFWFGYRPEIKKIGPDISYAYAKVLDLDIIDIPGDQSRFDNRDPLYVQSFSNYVGFLRRARNNTTMLQALNALALSYYELDDKENFEKYYYEIQDFISQIEIDNDIEIPDHYHVGLAFTLFNPGKTYDIYNKLLNLDTSTEYQKFYIHLREAIICYFKKEYKKMKSIVLSLPKEKIVFDGNENRDDSHSMSDTELEIINTLSKFDDSAYDQKNKDDLNMQCLTIFGNIGWGKFHKELAEKSINYFRSLS